MGGKNNDFITAVSTFVISRPSAGLQLCLELSKPKYWLFWSIERWNEVVLSVFRVFEAYNDTTLVSSLSLSLV